MGKRRRERDDIEENSDSERGSTDQNEQDGLDTSQRSQQPDHSPRDIQIPLRESIKRDQISPDSSLKQAEPNQDIETRSYDEVTVTTSTPPSRETIKSDVTQLAHPSTKVERGESELTISILAGGIRETITQRVTEQAKPESQMGVNEIPRIAVSRPPDVQKVKEKATRTSELTNQSSGLIDDIDMEDPINSWSASPYNTRRPVLILHKNPSAENVDTSPLQTVSLLQRLLRDAYTELEGGEPSPETATVQSDGVVRIPDVENSIVTLDLTDEAFEPSLEHSTGRPKIKYNGVEITSQLKEATSSLYSGDLGYLILNIPAAWEHEVNPVYGNFVDKLRVHLADEELFSERTREAGSHEVQQSPPVLLAEPRTTDPDELSEKTDLYFSLNKEIGAETTTVNRAERVQETALRKENWERVALTEKQPTGTESDEHYLWKAAIAKGLAEQIHDDNQEEDSNVGEFVESQNIISTERGLEKDDSDDRSNIYSDIYVDPKNDNYDIGPALKEFFGRETAIKHPVAIEFETGRSEGAFNFRKVRDTLEKYQQTESEMSAAEIVIVIPQRLLFRGKRRAHMIRNLVKEWGDEHGITAGIYVPLLNTVYCRALQKVDQEYIEQNLYEVEKDG
jgi:hypothetical protein